MSDERKKDIRSRPFPLQAERGNHGPQSISWDLAEIAYAAYASKFGQSQSIERIAERGGFGWSEMDIFYPDWRKADMLTPSTHAPDVSQKTGNDDI